MIAVFGILALAAVAYRSRSGAQGATIGNYTWEDTNMNGIQDKGEGPLTNILVELFIVGETTPEDDTRSNKDRMYKFEGVAEGDYRLKFTRPNDSTITEKDSE